MRLENMECIIDETVEMTSLETRQEPKLPFILKITVACNLVIHSTSSTTFSTTSSTTFSTTSSTIFSTTSSDIYIQDY